MHFNFDLLCCYYYLEKLVGADEDLAESKRIKKNSSVPRYKVGRIYHLEYLYFR